MTTFEYDKEDYLSELERELKIRRRGWRQRAGKGGKFISKEQQRQYDIMKELAFLIMQLGERRIHLLQVKVYEELNAQQKLPFDD